MTAVIQVAAVRPPWGREATAERTPSAAVVSGCGTSRLKFEGLTPVPEQDWRKIRARLAALKRHYPDRPDLLTDLRYELKVKHARDYITRLHADAPALSQDDLEGLASLLLSPAREGGEHVAAG